MTAPEPLFGIERGAYGTTNFRYQDDEVAPDPVDAIQARAEKERGLSLAGRGVEPSWRRWAESLVRELAASGQEFTFTDLYRCGLPMPPNSAWPGVVMNAMSKAGVVEMTGAKPSALKSTRGALVRTWRGIR